MAATTATQFKSPNQVPKDLGQGGAGLSSGASGQPSLKDLVNDLSSPIPPVTGTADATWSQNEVDMVTEMIRIVSNFLPGATTLTTDSVTTTYSASTQTLLGKLKTDVNAHGAGVASSAGATYDAGTVTNLGDLKTAINSLCSDKITVVTPGTYTAATAKLISQLCIRLNGKQSMVNR